MGHTTSTFYKKKIVKLFVFILKKQMTIIQTFYFENWKKNDSYLKFFYGDKDKKIRIVFVLIN